MVQKKSTDEETTGHPSTSSANLQNDLEKESSSARPGAGAEPSNPGEGAKA